jgi:hypothetical protein
VKEKDIRTGLQEIFETEGVERLLLLTKEGSTLMYFPDSAGKLQEFVKLFSIVSRKLEKLKELDMSFQNARILLKKLGEYYVLVATRPYSQLAMIRLKIEMLEAELH